MFNTRVDAGMRHTNTSMCTRGAEGDAPQLTPREADFQRDMQDSKPALLGPDAPLAGRDPVRARGDDWLLEVGLTAPRASWIRSLQS